MSETKFFDYLVLGGEDHGAVFSAPLCRKLRVRTEMPAMAKYCSPHLDSDAIEPEQIVYNVIEHTQAGGNHYFIATNESLSDTDVDSQIMKYSPKPIN